MWIERLKVEGGRLDGFDQKFSRSLNVLIGGRGTGKSSVIELIRFGLGASSISESGKQEAAEHALVVGARDAAELAHINIATGRKHGLVIDPRLDIVFVCSENATNGQAVQVFNNSAEKHPEQWQDPAALGVWFALQEVWPCDRL